MLTTNILAAEATKTVNGKKYIVHKVAAKETVFRITQNYKVSKEDLEKANPKLKANGLQTGMELLIPAGTGATAASTPAKATTPAKTNTNNTGNIVWHKVEAGETLFSIAKKYDTTVDDINKRNTDALKGGLKSGTVLKIAKSNASSAKSGLTVHEVKQGETLFGISKEYNVDVKDVQKLNPGIEKNGVKAGKSLIMPSTSRYLAQKNSNTQYRVHRVQKNETVFSISQKYRVSATELIQKNDLKSGLVEGQYIALPPEQKMAMQTKQNTQSATRKSKNVAHTVKHGETMFGICKTYKVSENDLVKANPELKNGLKAGRIVFIPRIEEKSSTWACGNAAGDSVSESADNIANQYITHGENKATIAIVLPYELKDGKIDKNTDKFLEFYEGALLAVEKLKKEGVDIKISVYNSGKTEDDINKLINKGVLADADIIVGPAYKAQFKPLGDYALSNNIKLVIPFSTRTEEVRTNPNMFLVNTPQAQTAENVAQLFVNKFKDKKIIIVRFNNEEYNDQAAIGDSIASVLKQNAIAFDDVKFTTTEDLNTYINEGAEHLFIATTTNQMALSDFLPSVNAIAKKENVEIFGFHEWNKYQSLSKDLYVANTYFASTFDIDFEKYTPKKFIKDYRKYFGQEPGNTQPMYGALGHDITLYFCNAVALFGRNFESHRDELYTIPVQSKFKFERLNISGGYYNANFWLSKNNKEDGHMIIE